MTDETGTDSSLTVKALLQRTRVLYQRGELQAALLECRQALALLPEHIDALYALAHLLNQAGDPQHAVATYQRIVELKPDEAAACNAMGTIFHEHGGIQQAVNCYQQAIRIKPDFVEAHNNLGAALQRLYLTDQATDSYRRALELEPRHPLWELRLASLCRPVAGSADESRDYRSRLLATLADFTEAGFTAPLQELVDAGAYPSYSLMYHGLDDRPIREAYARLYRPSFTAQEPALAATGRNRIGFVVTKTHEGLFVRSMGGVLRNLKSPDLELTVICLAGRESQFYDLAACAHIRILPLPEPLAQISRTLLQHRFDILYYWEIATDPLNYFLPFLRLAPIQCTSWGIQVSSGIPNVDYYLSSQLVESPDAAAHYTEKLICAKTLLTYQYRSRLPENPKRREDFGFRRDQHLYLFSQQMGKFHPDFDAVAGDILRRDKQGVLVILQGLWPYTAEQLRRRLSQTIGDVLDRVVFLPRLDQLDLLCLIADCEVLLDPPHYGGVNSSYDGFSVNTPILTCESPYHIGRYTAACYRKMGLSDCIVPDLGRYAELAVELGTNPEHRAAFSQRIRAASPALFEDADAVREHERIFLSLLNGLESR